MGFKRAPRADARPHAAQPAVSRGLAALAGRQLLQGARIYAQLCKTACCDHWCCAL